MRKLLLAGAAVFALPASSFAADIPVKALAYKAPPPMFSWTGCYGGIEGGWSWGRSRVTFADDGDLAVTDHVRGGLAGGTLGCNWQNGSWVWGIESDLSWSGLKRTEFELAAVAANPGETIGTKSNWLNTDRLRIGYAMDRSLWYLTGGVAVRDIRVTQIDA